MTFVRNSGSFSTKVPWLKVRICLFRLKEVQQAWSVTISFYIQSIVLGNECFPNIWSSCEKGHDDMYIIDTSEGPVKSNWVHLLFFGLEAFESCNGVEHQFMLSTIRFSVILSFQSTWNPKNQEKYHNFQQVMHFALRSVHLALMLASVRYPKKHHIVSDSDHGCSSSSSMFQSWKIGFGCVFLLPDDLIISYHSMAIIGNGQTKHYDTWCISLYLCNWFQLT